MNIRTLCLGILHFGDATGYEIRKLASEGDFSHFVEASFGAIYPALTRLTADGLVAWDLAAGEGKPNRKVYRITPAGRIALREAMYEPPRADIFKSEFLFLCLLCDVVGADHLREMIDRRLAQHHAERDRMLAAAQDCDHPGSQFAIDYGLALAEAAITFLERRGAELVASARRAESERAAVVSPSDGAHAATTTETGQASVTALRN